MKKLASIIAILISMGCSPSVREDQVIEVNFSPNGGAMEAVVREINLAKKDVLVQAYSFTNPSVGIAITSAHNRGVDVAIILDRENLGNKSSLLYPLHEKGIPIFIDAAHAIAHNKIVIIDSKVVITGSMNLTKAGNDSNAENSLIIKDSRLATRYMINWSNHQVHSQPFKP